MNECSTSELRPAALQVSEGQCAFLLYLPTDHLKTWNLHQNTTSPDDAVVMSSANGLVGTGFASWYRLQPRARF